MVDTSQAPYFDDYDAQKKYLKALFRPARALQVRELNQVQTYLQNQVSRLGDHIFRDGSQVIPGEVNYQSKLDYIKVTYPGYAGDVAALNADTFKLVDVTTGVEAELVLHIDAEDTDPVTLYVKYTKTGFDQESVFPVGSLVELRDSSDTLLDTITVDETGFGSAVFVESGIYYVRGYFAVVDKQAIVLDKYAPNPSYRAGFEIIETVVTSDDDASLLDNANGEPNVSAPGADRLKLELKLSKRAADATDDEDFVEIVRLAQGEVESQVRSPDYSVLEETLARRTFDESGNYTVTPFKLFLREHIDTGDNEGVYEVGEGGDATKLAAGLEAGKAYVLGYEVEKQNTTYIPIDKARDTNEIQNASTFIDYGNYIEVDNLTAIPDIGSYRRIRLWTGVLDPSGNAQGTSVGDCCIRNVELVSGTAGDPAAVYRLYLFDIRNTTGIPSANVLGLASSIFEFGSPNFGADIDKTGGVLYDPNKNSMLFPLPVSTVKSLRNGQGSIDTGYNASKQFTATADSGGTVTIDAGTSVIFESYNKFEFHASRISDGEIIDLDGKVTMGGTPFGKTLTIALGVGFASANIRVVAPVIKQVTQHKTKTLTNHVANFTPNAAGVITLAHADVHRIIRVGTLADNKKDHFDLIPNRKPSYYGLSQLKFKNGYPKNTVQVAVEYEYFAHGSGDYFSVDSYSDIEYDQIPFDTIDGVQVCLADVLDFRPRVDNTGNDFTSLGSSRGDIPQRFNYVTADVVHYLPRVDKVWLDSKGNFGVTKGVSDINPVAPSDPDDVMVLYTLTIPAYTRSPKSVDVKFHENKRYTMRDIGKLENRIKNLEYYVTLSSLEESTANLQVIDDATGLPRTKNGFVADSFVDHIIGDSTSNLYRCSVDSASQELRPQFCMDGIDLEFDSGTSSNVQKTGDLITLPYTSAVLFKQDQASSTMNVNPYAVFNWEGSLSITPKNDTWIDVVYTNPDIQRQTINQTVTVNDSRTVQDRAETTVFNNEWDIWRDVWLGRDTFNVRNWGAIRGINTGANAGTVTFVDEVRTEVSKSVATETNSKVVGDKVVNQSVIPFMRPKQIKFVAQGMKPFTRLYAFFDGKDVTSYVTDLGGGSPVLTDASGKAEGFFNLPNNDLVRFRTGRRPFKLSESSTNSDDSLTQAETFYDANGTLVSRQKTILSTQTVTTTVTNTTVTTQRAVRTRWQDPLAQSFLIDKEGGMFVTKIDIYFATKDDSIPITMQIREMENGYPTQRLVPYGEKVLQPSQVLTSSDASAVTSFVFDSPVYLQDGVEYCFVLLANSTKYNVWVGRMGEVVVGTQRAISKQPFVGVLFKSQNNSTWTADQEADMKFAIHRAVFNTAVQGNVVLNNTNIEAQPLPINALAATQGSSTVTVKCFNHGLVPGAFVTVSGAVTGAGITAANLNGQRQVVATPTLDTFTFTAATAATATGSFGGSALKLVKNFQYDCLNVNVGELILPKTETNWAINPTTGKSIDGSEVFGQKNGVDLPIILGTNMFFSSPRCILNSSNETSMLSGNRSLTVKGSMVSVSDNVSPVIDVNRLSAVAVNNRINNPGVLTEEVVAQSNAAARYQTKMISLASPADTLRVYIDANKPKGAEVKVYYKTSNTPDGFSEIDWVPATGISVSGQTDDGKFYENEYEELGLDEFAYFAVKIVMLSSNSANVPRVKNFRAIAISG